ncbi:hypothetical protein B0H19DRAFT_869171, partial [Mycena capillaripes]
IGNCETVAADIQAGLYKRDINGKVFLPSGAFVPRQFLGRNLRERFEAYHRANPNQVAAAQMMLGAQSNFAYTQSSNCLSIEERQQCLDEDNAALEKLRQAQYIQTRAQVRRTAEACGPIEEPEQPIRRIMQRTPPPAAPARFHSAPPAPNEPSAHRVPEHPYAKVRDAAYAEPKGRNFGAPAPSPPAAKRHDPAYRSSAPVVDNKIVADVFDRSLDTTLTITQRELLSISPDVRTQYKEIITARRVATEPQNTTTEPQWRGLLGLEQTVGPQLPENALVAQDKFATLYDAGVSPDSGELYVAVDACAIRSVLPVVDNQCRIECIYDIGSQIVAMSEAICNDLQLPYDPRITINMESANGSLTPSLGLARSVPFKFGEITLYLQVHIVRAPA